MAPAVDNRENIRKQTGLEIAVIGMAGRFPAAGDLDEFWDNLKNGVEATVFYSPAELAAAGVEPGLLENSAYVESEGAILEDAGYFDAAFFGYVPAEALLMDPQLRIFHECSWQALEDAGVVPGSTDGLIGLYAGATHHLEWEISAMLSGQSEALGLFDVGNLTNKDFLCTRVSYKLNLRGSSVEVQTACSTSLVAIHLACRALLTRECDMALAGGVGIKLPRGSGYLYREGMVMSPDGHCRAFDARANGTVGGNGAGVVVLKKLKDAAADRDHIYAIVKGSAVNNDGIGKAGFSAPGIEGQANAVRTALHLSRVEAESIGYIEAHGTGTVIGDPIEIEALKLAFNTEKKGFCAVGSVKTNIGHLDSAAGIAGFIKTVLALHRKSIPPSLHFETPNPKIDFENSPFYVNTRLTEWSSNGYPLRAGVSAFGIGGTNAHVVLEEAPWDSGSVDRYVGGPALVVFSAKTEPALGKMTDNLVEYFKKNPTVFLADVAYTLQVGREIFPYRKAALCSNVTGAIDVLAAREQGGVQVFHSGEKKRPLVFMFPGQGQQYVNMGLDLYRREPVFREEMDRCFEILKPLLGYDIKEMIYPGDAAGRGVSRFYRQDVVQPLMFVFEYALARLFMRWGLGPAAMIGYSIGEYVAACLAEVFSLEDALKLVVSRGKLMQEIPGGTMLSVPLPEERLRPLLGDDIEIAVVNGPSCIVSGTAAAIDTFEEKLKKEKCISMRLEISHAGHSRMMDPMIEKFREKVTEVRLHKPKLPYISNVTGAWITAVQAADPGYWAAQVRKTVRFSGGLDALVNDENHENAVFIELGPGRNLSTTLMQHKHKKADQFIINILRYPKQEVSDVYYLLDKIGRLWLYGAAVDWTAFYSRQKRNRLPLPTYPFEGRELLLAGDSLGAAAAKYLKGKVPVSTGKNPDMNEWFYLPSWKRTAFARDKNDKPPAGSNGLVYMLFVDDCGIGSQLAKRLEEKSNSRHVVIVKVGTEFAAGGNGGYHIVPGETGHYIRLFKELRQKKTIPGTIIHLWSVSRPAADNGPLNAGRFRKARESGFYSLVAVARAIEKANISENIKITVVSNNLQDVTGREGLCPEKAALLGPVNVIPQEYPNLTCRSIDIELSPPGPWQNRLIDRLMAETAEETPDKIAAFRGNSRWTRVFEPVRLEKTNGRPSLLKEKGVYWLIGGTGNIGMLLAEYLAKTIKARLILTGRSAFPARERWGEWLETRGSGDPVSRKILKIRELEDAGAEVLVLSGDVADKERMQQVIARIGKHFGTPDGVVLSTVKKHNLKAINHLDRDFCEEEFQSKVYGLLVLDELLKDSGVDFCILMSSLGSFLGGLGFTSYGSANLFMDAFVQRSGRTRTGANGPLWLAINWDAWSFDGDETNRGRRPVGASMQELAITPPEGMQLFNYMFSLDSAGIETNQLMISTGDFQARIDRWINLESVKEGALAPKNQVSPLHPRPNLTRAYAPPRDEVEMKLASTWQKFFGFEKVGIDDDFFELGGDSLKAITVSAHIHKELHIKIPLPQLFITPTIRGLITYIKASEEDKYTAVEAVEKREYHDLSSAQKRLYFLQRLDVNGTGYNLPFVLPLGKEIEKDKLEGILKKLVARHESLRTSFIVVAEVPVQRVHDNVEFAIEVFDLAAKNAKGREEKGNTVIERFVRAFDLSRAPLIRSGLVRLPGGNHAWIVDMHHIISDGTSHTILTEDFMTLYKGEKLGLPGLRIQYKDFSQWQNRLFAGGAVKGQEDYWLRLYAPGEEYPRLNLPTDRQRPGVFTFAGDIYDFRIEGEEVVKLKALADRAGATLYMGVLALLNTLFYKYTGQTDIIIGTGIAGRPHTDLEQIIGMFVNILPMRNYPRGDKRYLSFLKDVAAHSIEAFENQDVQFEELVDKLDLERDPSRNPLFDISMAVQNFRRPGQSIVELSSEKNNASGINYKDMTSKFDMTFFVDEVGEDIYILIEYYTGIFKEETIARLSNHFKNIVKAVVQNPAIELKDIDIISEAEKKRLLFEFNDTLRDYAGNKTIHELFAGPAAKGPHRAALVYEDETLSYKELDRWANRLAGYLYYEKGVGPEGWVGLWMSPSLHRPAAVLGILKAGAAYVPIDPSLPLERIKYMLTDAGIGVVISEKKYIKDLNRLQWECECFHSYLCVDSFDIHGEEEVEKNELMTEELWHHVGETAVDEITGGGWLSSYTGGPMSEEEMAEYGENIFKKLALLLHRRMRVLEIGTASGISMFRIAPEVGEYYGTDLSALIIRKAKARADQEGHGNITLAHLAAHEIDKLGQKNFGLIIMNSVVQCFHGHNYLRNVVKKAVALMVEEGYLFIGDIMDGEKKDALVKELAAFKKVNSAKGYTTKTDFSSELFLRKGFWRDLGRELAGIEDIQFSDKIYTIENELTKFRYDVLITVNKKAHHKKEGKKLKTQDDSRALRCGNENSLTPPVTPANPAYIIYTSGTTGRPKGVMIKHEGICNLNRVFAGGFGIVPRDNIVQFANLSFDASVSEIFMALLNGACLCMVKEEIIHDYERFRDYLRRNDITVATLPPPYAGHFDAVDLDSLRLLITAGSPADAGFIKKCSGHFQYINAYGPTENSICSSYWKAEGELDLETVPIGKPVANTEFYILNESMSLQPIGIAGELCIAGVGLARGYLNNPELTAEKFCLRRPGGLILKKLPPWTPRKNFCLSKQKFCGGAGGVSPRFSKEPPARRRHYKTGDLARWLPDGNIEFLGRIDQQVKIRGFRIELAGIESRLLACEGVDEAVVIDREDGVGERHLCGYIVAAPGTDKQEIKDTLAKLLPHYMIPSYLIEIEKIPLTPSGKIDRKALPGPEAAVGYVDGGAAPRNPIEKKLQQIWSEVLGLGQERIGMDANFFQYGGHSLKAITLIAKIHKEMGVKLPLAEVFKQQTVEEMAACIGASKQSRYSGIQPVEKKEYSPLSSAQKRLYFLWQMDPASTVYNMPLVLPLGKDTAIDKLESAVKKLIARHESLRTAFIMKDNEPVQKVFDEVEFRFDLAAHPFVRPFDLSRAPLIRSAVSETPDGGYTWMVDVHHIVSDGTSHAILAEEFAVLCSDENLAPLRLQYKDFSRWQNHLTVSGVIEVQADYWLGLYADAAEIPRLDLPTDYKRPEVFAFVGDTFHFTVAGDEAVEFKAVGLSSGATLFMNILAVLDILFYKYTGLSDIIIGVGTAGRPHADLQRIIGMFVNTLALRNYPHGEETYGSFLKKVVRHSVEALENQDVQFEELVERLDPERDTSRNPLVDISLVVQNFDGAGRGSTVEVEYKHTTTKFDMTFFVHEVGEDIYIDIEYYTGIFKQETVARLSHHFKNIVKAVIHNPGIQLRDIDILSEAEKKQLIVRFNDTRSDYPKDKTIHELFAGAVEKGPHRAALVYGDETLSYKELDRQARRLAGYLHEKGVVPEERVGLWMSPALYRPAAVLGILKAGGAYVPIDPSLPLERIKYMLTDAGIGVVVSGKKYIRDLNRLQWECRDFHSYLCVDSFDIHGEEEGEKNELMTEELWHHVGETAVDEITGGGWLSSYTGEAMSKEEMAEYGENIFKKLAPLLHKKMRVLEIGTASGISMFRIAPGVGEYYGTDLSAVIIRETGARAAREGHRNITLAHLAAHEIDKLGQRNFDLIIMNSVVQCFHGHNYLRNVVKKAVDLTAEQGYLFLGDIMDGEKKDALVKELTAFKKANAVKGYTTKTDFSSELFLSKGYWRDLGRELAGIEDIRFSDKIYTIENELTRFRYDVLIKVNKKARHKKEGKKLKTQDDSRALRRGNENSLSPAVNINPANPAYIIYTSGTTGRPKGVMIKHEGISSLNRLSVEGFGIVPRDNIIQFANLSFDASVWEMFMALLNGACLHLLNEETINDYGMFLGYLKGKAVTVATLPPTYAAHLDVTELRVLRLLITGGSPADAGFVEKCSGHFQYINAYGPTESTICCSYWQAQGESNLETVPIGKPVPNTGLYIVNDNMSLQPIGIAGELCIAGVGLAGGYQNNPELTAEKFCLSKQKFCGGAGGGFSKEPPARRRHYKTGDLARWLSDGNIEFLGRIDQQVKIRGFRIELAEIKSGLLACEGVDEAVVIDREDGAGEKYLCGYIVAAPGTDKQDIKGALAKLLPHYMIPSYLIEVEKIPLTASGKVDRKVLPAPEAAYGYTAGGALPRNPIEKKLQEIWSEVLGLEKERISMEANFFQYGGHSLKAITLISKIHKELGVKLPLAEVFKHQVLRGLSTCIEQAKKTGYSGIEPVEKKEYYALSSAQKRMYVLQQMELNSTAYNIPMAIPLRDNIKKDQLEGIFKKWIARHEILRTSFERVKEVPVQRLHAEVTLAVEYHSAVSGDGYPADLVRPFDLSRAPLLRVGIHVHRSTLLLDMHHIISDGTSHGILAREFNTLLSRPGEELPALRLQYKDYSEWNNGPRRRESITRQKAYWLQQFCDELPVLNLPADFPRPMMQDFEGNIVNFGLSTAETKVLKDIAADNDITLYMALLAVVNLLLSKLGGQEDIIVGTPVAARRHADLEHVIGMLVNTLPMRNYPSRHKTCREFFKEVGRRTLEAYEYQEYPFEELVDELSVSRDTGRNPVFDVMFNLLNQSEYPREMPPDDELTAGENITLYEHKKASSRFDMTLNAVDLGKWIYFGMEYSTRLFTAGTIEGFIKYFKRIISLLPAHMDKMLAELEIIPAEEKKQILMMSSGIREKLPPATIHQLFQQEAEEVPERIALVFGGKHLGYRELNRRANQLAHLLKEKGVGPGTVVGLMVDRSLAVEMITALPAILKTGAACLPIDTGYPTERVIAMLADSSAPVLLTGKNVVDRFPAASLKNKAKGMTGKRDILLLDELEPGRLAAYSPRNPVPACGDGPGNPVYVIYTSGSTGKPKGVIMEHRNLVNLVKYQYQYTNIDFNSVLQFASIGFDVSFQEIFSTLLRGGKLHLVDSDVKGNIPGLFEMVGKCLIKTLFLPTSFFKFLTNERDFAGLIPPVVDHIVTAGEQLVLPGGFENRLAKNHIYLHNHYGPSETHVVTTFTLAPGGSADVLPPIGKPVMNTKTFILDRSKHPQPVGVAGELYIGGVQVGRGYLNNPELTAEKFTKKIYKTGDLCRWLPDGTIQFLGRMDNQVKIRGFRVEPGEIESRLMKIPFVKEAVVVDKEEKSGQKYLCAYIVSDKDFDAGRLREYLAKILPPYMVPAHFVSLEKIPLTISGKIHRKSLPEPGYETTAAKGYCAPRDHIERKVAEIWSGVLDTAKNVSIGIDDNFFQLGGHSLNATILTARIHEALNVKIPLAEIFKTPTVRGLAQYIKKTAGDKYTPVEAAEKKEYYPLSYNQQRLWTSHRLEPGSPAYHLPALVVLEHAAEEETIKKVLYRLIERHAAFRTCFRMMDNEPVQMIKECTGIDMPLKFIDISSLPGEEKEKKREQLYAEAVEIPFDLSGPPLFRSLLLKMNRQEYHLVFNMHHIISDGWSIELLKKEFFLLYGAHREGKGPEVEPEPLRCRYVDFAQWQRGRLNHPGYKEKSHLFWRKILEQGLPRLQLPLDYREAGAGRDSAAYRFALDGTVTSGLLKLAEDNHTGIYVVILATLNLLLARLSGEKEIVTGLLGAGREHTGLHGIVGFFVNTLVVKSPVDYDGTYLTFLRRVNDRVMEIMRHQDYPLESVLEDLKIRFPDIPVMFNMFNMNEAAAHRPMESFEPYHLERVQDVKFDITIYATLYNDGIEIQCHYRKGLFKKETVAYIMGQFDRLFKEIVENPHRQIKEYLFEKRKKRMNL